MTVRHTRRRKNLVQAYARARNAGLGQWLTVAELRAHGAYGGREPIYVSLRSLEKINLVKICRKPHGKKTRNTYRLTKKFITMMGNVP